MNYIKHSLCMLLLASLSILSSGETIGSVGYMPALSSFDLIVGPNKLPQKSTLKMIPSGDVVVFFDGICCNISDSTSATIVFPDEFKPHDIYWDFEGNCFLSDGHALYLYVIDAEECIRLFDVSKSLVKFIIGASGVLYYEEQGHDLYKCDIKDASSSLFWHFDDMIHAVAKAQGGYFVGYGNKIAIITDDQQFIPIIETSQQVNTIAITEDGVIFYGTDDELGYYDSSHNYMSVLKKGVVDLLYTDNSLYVFFNDKSIARLNNISKFRELSLDISNLKKDAKISCQISDKRYLLQYNQILAEPGEFHISSEQLCLIPDHGLFLLTGNELISIEGDEEISLVHIPSQLLPEDLIFTEDDVLACDDTTIVSCKSSPNVLFAFDTNQFHIWPTTDNNIFVTVKVDETFAIYHCDPIEKIIEPFIKLNEDVVLLAGDTAQCIIVTPSNIYLVKEKNTIRMLNYFEPIRTATLTKEGVVFSTGDKILLLEGINKVALLCQRSCKKLLSDSDTLYVYAEDGSLVSFKIKPRN